MNQGPNQPQQPANPGGGAGGRRRRRKRGPGPGPGKKQFGAPQGAHHPGKKQHNGGHAGRKNRVRRSGPAFVGPMDHSYLNAQNNGNLVVNYKPARGGNGNPADTGGSLETKPIIADSNGPARIFCFIEDLFFLAKIQEVARKLNVKVEFVKTVEPVLERAKDEVPENERPALVIVDLNNLNIKPLTIIPKLRAKLKKNTSVIGFVSHVQGDLKVKAQEAGCDMVMPRSAFSQNLPNLLRRHSEEELHHIEGNRI